MTTNSLEHGCGKSGRSPSATSYYYRSLTDSCVPSVANRPTPVSQAARLEPRQRMVAAWGRLRANNAKSLIPRMVEAG